MAKKKDKSPKSKKKGGGRAKFVLAALGLGGAVSAAAWHFQPDLVQTQVDRVRQLIGM